MSTLLLSTFLGGIVGALLMDISETLAARYSITSGVNIALVGRWAAGLANGTFYHRDIRETPAMAHEVAIGWLFHFLVAGGGVALLLPLGVQIIGTAVDLTTPRPWLLFGLATSLLPWFILLPSFGWGVWGRHGPAGSNALLASTFSHIPYGLGIWLTVRLGETLLTTQ